MIDWTELIEKYQDAAEDRKQDEKKEKDKKVDERKKTSAKQVEAVDNFIKAFDGKQLYDDAGDLKEKAGDQILHKRVMGNIIGGVIDENKANIDEKKKKIILSDRLRVKRKVDKAIKAKLPELDIENLNFKTLKL